MVDRSVSSSDTERRSQHRTTMVLVLVAASCVIGVFSDRGALLAKPWSVFAELGTPFVLVAFAAGRLSTRMALGVLSGAAVLSIGLAAYYAWLLLVQDVAWGTLTYQYRAGAWITAGVLVGALVGALGSASRPERNRHVRALGWGLLIASPLAEAVRVCRWEPPQVGAGVALLMLGSALCVWAVRRDGAPRRVVAVAGLLLVPAVFLAENFRHLLGTIAR